MIKCWYKKKSEKKIRSFNFE